jgi:hypothetical protein
MRYSGPPMTLGNMRANGARVLAVCCERCHHDALSDVSEYADEVRCPRSGTAHGLHALRRDWRRRAAELGRAPRELDVGRSPTA